MKIVDRTAFLALAPGTVFYKFNPHTFEDLAIKEATIGNDYVVQTLTPDFVGSTGSEDDIAAIFAMLDQGEERAVEYDCAGRDGLFDRDQLFGVLDLADLDKLIARLQEARGDLSRHSPDERSAQSPQSLTP